MICKNFSRFFAMLAVPVIILFACFGAFSIEAAAEDVVTYSQWSVNDTLSFFGNSFAGNVTVGGVQYSTTFNYVNTALYDNYIDGINIETNDVINSNSLSSYQILVYKGSVSSLDGNNCRGDIYIPIDIHHTGGLRFFVGAVANTSSSSSLDPSFTGNDISSNTGNLIGLSRAPASASSSSYYNLAHTRIRDSAWGGLSFQSRLLTYNSVSSSISFIQFQNVASLGRDFFIFIATPYSYDDVSHESAITTAVTSTTDSSSSGGAVTIINNNTDLTETNGLLGSIISAITGVVDSIINGIKNIFVPSDEFMEDFGDELDAIKARFEWSEEIKDIGADFKDILQNQENASAPVVVLPSITNSKDGTVYTTGGENVLDLGEFETEVLIVRGILAVLLWVFFLWRLYARLPDIIHGSGMIVGDGNRIMNELDERQSQSVFNDIETHANSIFQGTMPDITYIDNPDKVDWKV